MHVSCYIYANVPRSSIHIQFLLFKLTFPLFYLQVSASGSFQHGRLEGVSKYTHARTHARREELAVPMCLRSAVLAGPCRGDGMAVEVEIRFRVVMVLVLLLP